MTLEEFIISDEVAPEEISTIFAGVGLLDQFSHQVLSGCKEIKILYFKPESFANKDGKHSYFSIHEILVDSSGNIIKRIAKC